MQCRKSILHRERTTARGHEIKLDKVILWDVCRENQFTLYFQVCPNIQKVESLPLQGTKTTAKSTPTPIRNVRVWECFDPSIVDASGRIFAFIGSKVSHDLHVKIRQVSRKIWNWIRNSTG